MVELFQSMCIFEHSHNEMCVEKNPTGISPTNYIWQSLHANYI
jgi:hypothetical protein